MNTGMLQTTHSMILAHTAKPIDNVELKDLSFLFQEIEDVIETCENLHLVNVVFAPPFLIAEIKKTVDHANSLLYRYCVNWSPAEIIVALEKKHCRIKTLMLLVWKLQEEVQKLRLSMREEECA